MREDVKRRTYTTELRYPEFLYIPSIDEAKRAIDIAEKVKQFVIRKLTEKGYG